MRIRNFALVVMALVLLMGIATLAQPPAIPQATLPIDSAAVPPPTDQVAVSATDDPMQVVDAFVQKNRKEAEDSIGKLTKEAETLRARLQKVEAALERWKAVEHALKRAPAKVSEVSPQLEPIPSEPPVR